MRFDSCGRRASSRQRGQSLVEFLVAGVFMLVPLFLAVAALGKFIDVQHTTSMAARYAAWERTVWYDGDSDFNAINAPNRKTADAINNEIAARLMSDRSTATTVIRATDSTSGGLINGIDPMWRDASGTAYLQRYDQLENTQGSEAPGSDFIGSVLDTISSVNVRGVGGFVPPVPAETMAVADVSLRGIAAESASYQRLWSAAPGWSGLDFVATGAILSNSWAANSRAGTRAMVARTVPTANAAVGAMVYAAQAGIAPWDPIPASGIEVGKIDVEVVPDDRLK